MNLPLFSELLTLLRSRAEANPGGITAPDTARNRTLVEFLSFYFSR
jgi:hypothetical protein